MQRIMIAGTASGSGKTTIVCAILQAFVNRGLKTAAFKCGPDYIDPMFHSRIIGTKSRNLDGYFMDKKTLNALLYKNARGMDIAVIEGVMGYYDGLGILGMEDTASSYALAKDTETPVILVVPCKGMGRSALAVLDGYVNFKDDSHIKGVIFNQLAPSLYPAMKAYCEKNNIRALGCFPKTEKAEIGSRHLGLITADEITDLKEKMQHLAQLAEEYIDLDGILEMAQTAEKEIDWNIEARNGQRLRIAVARDRAFCFYYEDNLELLRELGCEIVEFSPIADKQLPKDIDGLILGGGYPELYAEALEKNDAMRQDVKEKILEGIPTHAECGGFLYLHREITTPDGTTNKMAGVLDGTGIFTEKLQHFGYVELEALKDNLLCQAGDRIRAHEFHRCVSNLSTNTFRATKGGREWFSFFSTNNLLAGFPHIHYYANPQFARNFVEKCAEYSVKRSSKPVKDTD